MRRVWTSAAVAVLAVLLLGAPAGAAPSEQDRRFLIAAHQANVAAIAAGRLAQQKAISPVVRELGRTFVADHAALDADVIRLAQQLDLTLPAEPTESQKASASRMRAATGAAFDRLWIDTQRAAMTTAMNDVQTELARGTELAARQAAADAQPVLASHHDGLRKAAAQMSAPSRVESGIGAFDTSVELVAIVGLGMILLLAGLWLRRREPV